MNCKRSSHDGTQWAGEEEARWMGNAVCSYRREQYMSSRAKTRLLSPSFQNSLTPPACLGRCARTTGVPQNIVERAVGTVAELLVLWYTPDTTIGHCGEPGRNEEHETGRWLESLTVRKVVSKADLSAQGLETTRPSSRRWC